MDNAAFFYNSYSKFRQYGYFNYIISTLQSIERKCEENVSQHELYESCLRKMTDYLTDAHQKLASCKTHATAKQDLLHKQQTLQVCI